MNKFLEKHKLHKTDLLKNNLTMPVTTKNIELTI